jgi:hypothetical protein
LPQPVGPDHQDVLGRDLFAQPFGQLLAPPTVAQRTATARLASDWPMMCASSAATTPWG